MKEKEILKHIENRLDELIKYFNVLDDKYKINVLKDIKNKIKGVIEKWKKNYKDLSMTLTSQKLD